MAIFVTILFLSKEIPTNVMKTLQLKKSVEKAKTGDKAACWNLYLHYEEIGDKDNTLYWLHQCSLLGDAKAQYQIFAILKDSKNQNEKTIALQELEKSANNKLSLAELELGKAYKYGTLLPVDNDKAKYWLKKAALNGEISAMLQLAELLHRVDHAIVKAYAWTVLAKNVAESNRAYEEDINDIQQKIIEYAIEHKVNINELVRKAEMESKGYKKEP